MTHSIEFDIESMKVCIRNRWAFRIGARGICCDCYPLNDGRWNIRIERAFIFITCRAIDVWETAHGSLWMGVSHEWNKEIFEPLMRLNDYTKLTYLDMVRE